ncbi:MULTISPECIES: SSI family serine proteinase inhibitor [Streptomyces]|uniref:SSI family serine proteinase inhibitor n=1 Tax=Streptomyces TaxID=1883 RepID=UPI0022488141|nr:SSI family serine proteinase inhibitor [Streptomyces sp. JHD 1]MCX2968727.1 SSI family serine proteinase inhibitor [Streptomyces sp. JHD 1]
MRARTTITRTTAVLAAALLCGGLTGPAPAPGGPGTTAADAAAPGGAAAPRAAGPDGAADSADGAGAGAGPTGSGRLFLTVSGADDTWVRGVELRCGPAAGHHPHAAAACAALAAADGDLDALPGAAAPECSRVPDPVHAAASGTYRERPVEWRGSYPNSCFLHAATGPVFRF